MFVSFKYLPSIKLVTFIELEILFAQLILVFIRKMLFSNKSHLHKKNVVYKNVLYKEFHPNLAFCANMEFVPTFFKGSMCDFLQFIFNLCFIKY